MNVVRFNSAIDAFAAAPVDIAARRLRHVALGAFAAHGLKERLEPELLAVFETGARYHFYHSLGLIGVGLMLSFIFATTGSVIALIRSTSASRLGWLAVPIPVLLDQPLAPERTGAG